MKIGFYTSTFNDRPLEEVLDFAAEAGFDAIEIDAAGHIKRAGNVAAAVAKARERQLFVASVTLVGNQLDPEAERRAELRARTADFAQAVGEAGVPILVIFRGRDGAFGGGELSKLRRACDEPARRDSRHRPAICNRELARSEERLSGDDARRVAAALCAHPRPALRTGVRPLAPHPAGHRSVRGVRRGEGAAQDPSRQGQSIDGERLQSVGWHRHGMVATACQETAFSTGRDFLAL